MDKFSHIFNDEWCIGQNLFDYIKKLLAPGSVIVELGSGRGTLALTSLFKVYSIENDTKWLNLVSESNYIHAPLQPCEIPEFPSHKMWYDPNVLKQHLPEKYDLILVDGPLGSIGRGGFYHFLSLFRSDVPIIFDDIDRAAERKLANLVSEKLHRPLTIVCGAKDFGVVLPKEKVI